MTLQSFKTYRYICSKTKSYQIQRRFLLLFIFLGYEIVLSSCMPSDRTIQLSQNCFIFSHTFRPFQSFCSISYATKFYKNFDVICIVKALDQDPFLQLSRAFSSLSPLLVASNDKCPRVTSMQLASLVEELNKHQRVVLCYV